MRTTGSCPTTYCTIGYADYENGGWDIRATVTTPLGDKTKEYRIDGSEGMSYAALQDGVIEAFALDMSSVDTDTETVT